MIRELESIIERFRVHTTLLSILLAAVFAVAVGYFAAQHTNEATTTIRTIRQAEPAWLVVVVAMAFIVEGALVLSVGRFLHRLGHAIGWSQVTRGCCERLAVGTLSPFPGPGLVAFIAYLRPRGVPAAESVLTLALHSLTGMLSFCVFLVPVLVLLVIEDHASAAFLAGAGGLGVVVVIFAVVSVLVLRPAGPPPRFSWFVPHFLVGSLRQARAHHIRPGDLAGIFGIDLVANIAGAAMLGAALLATGDNPGLATVVAAYAVATLFMLVAPIFAGAGFVEVGAVVVLRALGVPIEQAVAATIIFRIGRVGLPFLVALSVSVVGEGQVRRQSAHIPECVVLGCGLLAIASVIAPPERYEQTLQSYAALDTAALSRMLVLISGFALLYLTGQLWQQRRTAWVLACVVLAVAIPAHLLREDDRYGAAFYAATLALLLLHWHRFSVRGDVPNARGSLIEASVALLSLFAYGVSGFWFLDSRVFGQNFTLFDASARTARTFILLGDSGLTSQTGYGRWFLDSLQLMGVVTIAFIAYTIARPVRAHGRHRPPSRT